MFSFLFFFKQKTAYEMRISDWSSDVCSSDLNGQPYAQASLLSERIVAAAEKTGIGLTMLPVLYQYSGFGAQPPRADQQRFINTPEQLMALLETLRAAYPEGPQRRYGVAPHSLRAVSDESLAALLRETAIRFPEAPVHIHVAEQQAEVEACVANYGARPVQWLLNRFPVDQHWCLVHATHLDADETRLLDRKRVV